MELGIEIFVEMRLDAEDAERMMTSLRDFEIAYRIIGIVHEVFPAGSGCKVMIC
jgi:hypothetical protein